MEAAYQMNAERRPFEWLTRVAERRIEIELSPQNADIQGVVQMFFDVIVHFFMYRFNQNYRDFYDTALQGRVSVTSPSSTSQGSPKSPFLKSEEKAISPLLTSSQQIFGSATPLSASQEVNKELPMSPLRLNEQFDLDWSSDEEEKTSLTPPISPTTSQTSIYSKSPEAAPQLPFFEEAKTSPEEMLKHLEQSWKAYEEAQRIQHRFSDQEIDVRKQEVNAYYREVSEAKEAMQRDNATRIPSCLNQINERMVPEFRFQLQPDLFGEGPATYVPSCHRLWGTNTDTLFQLSSGLCYPANRCHISSSSYTYIQAEAPQREKPHSKLHYYQMALESGSNLLLATSTGFQRWTQHGVTTITPHADTMDFLNPGETLDCNGTRIQCLSEEIIPLSAPMRDLVGLDPMDTAACSYHVRRLEVTEPNGQKRLIYQIVPDFTSIASSFILSQYTVAFVNLFIKTRQVQIDHHHPLIVNCITGRDRSGQFIVLDSMYKDIQTLLFAHSVDDVLAHTDVVGQMLIRATMLALQSTEGAAIDSFEQTLLPNFFRQLSLSEQINYSDLKPEVKQQLQEEINHAYLEWWRGYIPIGYIV